MAQQNSAAFDSTGPSTNETPYLVASAPGVSFVSIAAIGDDDGVYDGPAAPGSEWRMAGIPDGLGAFDNGDGTLTVLMNHELGAASGAVRDHGSTGAFVSRLTLDKDSLEVLDADDLIRDVFLYRPAAAGADPDGFVQETTAFSRFCSSDLAEASAYLFEENGVTYGTRERIYLTGEESGAEGRAFAVQVTDGDGDGRVESDDAYELPWLGKFSWENALASPHSQLKTVVVSTDDSTPGEVYVYVGEKKADGDSEVEKAGLTDGRLFGVRVENLPVDNAATPEQTVFRLQEQGPGGDASLVTGAQLQAESTAELVTKFARPEDGHWDPTDPNRFYFVTTGSGVAPTRLWSMDFVDIERPELGGKLNILLEGGQDEVVSLDNMTMTESGLVVLQEDPGGSARLAKVWLYDPNADTRNDANPNGASGLTELAQHDPARFSGAPVPAPFGVFNNNEESSGVIDVTASLGDGERLAFLLDTQAHYQASDRELVEGGQLMAMYVERPNPGDSRFNGGRGDDRFEGGFGDDNLSGGSGADDLRGDEGADRLRGDGGDDRLDGGTGADRIDGGSGSDRASGGTGDDRISGDSGNDTLDGGVGDDRLEGDSGRDLLLGGFGDDRLDGGSDHDTLDGAQGNDRLHGGSGDDLLSGGSGRDTLTGGSGRDTLEGGAGDDRMDGGSGRDTFVFRPGFGDDRIANFDAREDVLDFSALGSGGRTSQQGGDTLISFDDGSSVLLSAGRFDDDDDGEDVADDRSFGGFEVESWTSHAEWWA